LNEVEQYCRLDRYKYTKTIGDTVATLPPGSIVFELGAWWGRTTSYMAARSQPGCKIFAVDNFNGSMNHIEIPHFEKYLKIGAAKGFANPQDFFWAGVKMYDKHRNVRLYEGEFDDCAVHCKDGAIDLLFVDGDHFQTTHDLVTWWPKVKKGGIIYCHDVDKQHFTVGEEFRQFCEYHDRCWDMDGELGWVVK